MTLDELLALTENIKIEISELVWHEDDVRHSFFGLYYSGIYDFYIGKTTFRLAEYLGQGKVAFTGDIFDFNPHAKRLYEIQGHPMLSAGFHNDLNRNVIFGTWTAFEFSISLIFDYLVTDHEYESIIKKLNAELVKAISSLEESSKTLILDILKKSSFVPLFRKMNFILKRIPNCYPNTLKEDREFVEFVGKLRNCMIHSNGYYRGNYFKYEFGDTVFEFEDKQIFSQIGTNQFVYLEIAIKLKEIFRKICNCTNDIEDIPYPEDGQNIIKKND